MASIEDRWFRPGPDGEREPTPRHGRPGRWRVRYTDPSGRARAKSYGKRVDAEAFRATVAADMLRGAWVDPQAGRRTLGHYAAEWLASRNWDVSTMESQRGNCKHITTKLGTVPLGQLRPSQVQAFITGLPLAASTIGGVLTTLRAILSAAVDDGLIVKNVAKSTSVHAPRVTRRLVVPWTPGQVSAIRAGMAERYRAMVDCGALGLRQGEIFGLAVEEIDFLRRVVHVRQQVKTAEGHLMFGPPKGGKERDVPLPRQVALRLAAHIEEHSPAVVALPWTIPTGTPSSARLLFTTPTGRPLRRRDFNLAWKAGLRAAGMVPARETGITSCATPTPPP